MESIAHHHQCAGVAQAMVVVVMGVTMRIDLMRMAPDECFLQHKKDENSGQDDGEDLVAFGIAGVVERLWQQVHKGHREQRAGGETNEVCYRLFAPMARHQQIRAAGGHAQERAHQREAEDPEQKMRIRRGHAVSENWP